MLANLAVRNPKSGPEDAVAARELLLWIEANSEPGFNSQRKAIEDNLYKKFKKGVYDPDKAVKLWMYLVDRAASVYEGVPRGGRPHIPSWLNKATRKRTATQLARQYEHATGMDAKKNPNKKWHARQAAYYGDLSKRVDSREYRALAAREKTLATASKTELAQMDLDARNYLKIGKIRRQFRGHPHLLESALKHAEKNPMRRRWQPDSRIFALRKFLPAGRIRQHDADIGDNTLNWLDRNLLIGSHSVNGESYYYITDRGLMALGRAEKAVGKKNPERTSRKRSHKGVSALMLAGLAAGAALLFSMNKKDEGQT